MGPVDGGQGIRTKSTAGYGEPRCPQRAVPWRFELQVAANSASAKKCARLHQEICTSEVDLL